MKRGLYLLAFILGITSCQKDDFETISTPNSSVANDVIFIENFGASTTSNFIGRIVNEAGGALKDVQITIGNSITSTDHNGVFVLNNVSVHEKFAYVKASKSGYINGSRAVVTSSTGANDIQITLLKKNTIATVSSGMVSEVSLPNGSKVAFQGGFINSSGNAYTGQVEVSMHYLQPNQEVTFTQMPGMLFAQDVSNNARSLETYGMLGVNLYSPSGEQLNIAETSPATLTFPVDISTPNAPETIALWHFDETVGYWKEQGQAIKMGNEYVAEVTHFTWWNCDLSLDYVNVCFTINTPSEFVLSNNRIQIIRDLTNQVIFSGYTNQNGEECGVFPVNEEVTINVLSYCSNTVIHTQTIGPYSSDTSVSITIPSLPSDTLNTNITGSFTSCLGTPITNGYALLFSTGSSLGDYQAVNIIDGQFNLSFTYCNGDQYKIIIYNNDSSQFSSNINEIEVSLTSNNTNLGEITTCNQSGGTFNGLLRLWDQPEVDEFGLYGFNTIEGDLWIGEIEIAGEPKITSLEVLNTITNINGNLIIAYNPNLSSLEGLNDLISVEDVTIAYNPNLSNYCALQNLLSNGTYGSVSITNNSYSPTAQDFIDGNCAQ